ncbi:MAG: selenocysteine-specific translation elongation factor [Chloroflexota bacterium]|nr:selenocysteine-specific translation elongation factor [Chloroflexota bacterium]
MRVIGTAGHVDHGKSTLVKALTGIDPDRLKEEKEREMTIDLGFAWLTLPSGNTVSIVDVPGHEAFIKNMLAGVGGIDAALLVIAADEGVMPQTREHLAILDLLQVKGGVVALTKIDMVEGRDWIDLVSADVRKELAETVLANAKIIPVSSKTRAGLEDLLAELDRLLQVVSPKNDFGKPRLPIDRVFSIAGFGTVVTGTLIDGSFSTGQEVEIVPGGKRGRIRGLQTHKEKIDHAAPGNRVAMNLSGLAVDELARGQVVALPGTLAATTLVDARMQYLASAPKALAHNAEVDFFSGSAQVPARVRLLDHETLKPGDSGWVQVQLAHPVALAKNDRFIVRFASPSLTVGGGTVVDPNARTRHRRFRADLIVKLETLARGTPGEIVLQFLTALGANPADAKEIAGGTGISQDALAAALDEQKAAGAVVALSAQYFIGATGWHALAERIRAFLDEFHRQYPLRVGLPREELKSRLGLAPRLFDAVIESAAAENVVAASGDVLRRPDFSVKFTPELQRKADALLAQFAKARYAPPSAQEALAAIGTDALNALVTQDKLVRLNESVVLSPAAFAAMRDWVIEMIRAKGQVTAGEVRDQFDTSRKYAIALLEYLDEKRVTKRVGDARVLR